MNHANNRLYLYENSVDLVIEANNSLVNFAISVKRVDVGLLWIVPGSKS